MKGTASDYNSQMKYEIKIVLESNATKLTVWCHSLNSTSFFPDTCLDQFLLHIVLTFCFQNLCAIHISKLVISRPLVECCDPRTAFFNSRKVLGGPRDVGKSTPQVLSSAFTLNKCSSSVGRRWCRRTFPSYSKTKLTWLLSCRQRAKSDLH